MKTAVILLSALTLTACATTPTPGPVPAGFSPEAGRWVGWMRFSGEEFQLYPDELESRRGFSQACVSGSLPRDLQRQARLDLGGQRVVVEGRTTGWSAGMPGDRLDHGGSNITNACRKDTVILASSIVAN
jgi:hypothetical protein